MRVSILHQIFSTILFSLGILIKQVLRPETCTKYGKQAQTKAEANHYKVVEFKRPSLTSPHPLPRPSPRPSPRPPGRQPLASPGVEFAFTSDAKRVPRDVGVTFFC